MNYPNMKMSIGSGTLLNLKILPFLAVLATATISSPASAESAGVNQADKPAAQMLGPSNLRSLSDLTPHYFRFYDPNEVGWSDYDWSVGNMLARHESGEKRKRGAEEGNSADPPTIMGKRLFVARIGKRGRMMPIYRARVG